MRVYACTHTRQEERHKVEMCAFGWWWWGQQSGPTNERHGDCESKDWILQRETLGEIRTEVGKGTGQEDHF